MQIRPFTTAQIPEALTLCSQAGWNHLASDWQRCLTLLPEACLGGFEGDRLVATCTLTGFGSLAWVGTFLLDESLRGQGFGKELFQAAFQNAQRLGFTTLGLDSSDVGRPIYQKRNFQLSTVGVELWTGPPASHSSVFGTEVLRPEHRPSLWQLDQKATGVDRRAQLELLSQEDGSCGRVIVDSQNRVTAFGFTRPGKNAGVIGPVVATNFEQAERILIDLMTDRYRFDGAKPIAVAVVEQPLLREWLTDREFQLRRRNLRMFWPVEVPVLAGPMVYGSTALGMG